MNCYFGNFQKNTSTGNQAITGVGFQPSAIIVFDAGVNSNGAWNAWARYSLGASGANGVDKAVYGNAENDSLDATRNAGAYINRHYAIASQTIQDTATLVSLDADGFTVNWSVAPGGTKQCKYFAIGDVDNSRLLTFTSPTSTGTKAITGMGFQPDAVIVFSNGNTSEGQTVGFVVQMGFSDGTNEFSASSYVESLTSPSETARAISTTKVIRRTDETATVEEANVDSFDSDGVTFNFTTVTGTARYYYVLGIKFNAGDSITVGNDTSPTTATTKSTNTTNRPAGVLLLTNGTTGTAVTADSVFCLGGFSATTERGTAAFTVEDNVSSAHDVESRQESDEAIQMIAVEQSIVEEADVSAIGSSDFTLDWTTADASERAFGFMAFEAAAATGGRKSPIAGWSLHGPLAGPVQNA